MINNYMAGDVIEFTATVTDSTGSSVDPTSISFMYQVGTNLPVTLVYSGAAVPAVGIVARTGVGVYQAQVDTTGLAGLWTYQWQSTGTGQAIAGGTGIVAPALL